VTWEPPPKAIQGAQDLGLYTAGLRGFLVRMQQQIQDIFTHWGQHFDSCFFHVYAFGYNVAVAQSATSFTVALTTPGIGGTDYGVFAIPSWGTTVWYSGKSKSQVVLNFGTAAPASATIDYCVWRGP